MRVNHELDQPLQQENCQFELKGKETGKKKEGTRTGFYGMHP